jgi:uncharacterized cupredoxin-like copper-binding protein
MPATMASTSSRALLPLLALALGTPASSQNFSHAPVVQVSLADFKFVPPTIRLSAGKPVILRLANVAQQAHEFAAPQFFGAATVRQGDAKSINKEGEAEVAPGTRVEIGLVPKAGTYHLQCNKPGHAQAGMQGTIIVK